MTTTIKPFAPKPPNMTPIAPVTPDDDRPAIRDLLDEHGDYVQKIKASLESNPLYDSKLHDDLWMLRFWLSHKSSSSSSSKKEIALQSAIDAAVETLEFRKKYKLDEVDIRRSKWPEWDGPNGEVITPADYVKWSNFKEKYTDVHCQLHPDRGLLSFIKLSGKKTAEMLAGLSYDEELQAQLVWSEWRFQVSDEVTRRTGRLTKHAMIIDLGGMGMKHMNRKASVREGSINNVTQNVYPQINGGFFLINMPSIMRWFISLVRPLYPKRLMEKMDVVVTESDVNRIYPRFAELHTIPKCFRGTHPSWPPPQTGSKFAEDNY